MKSKSEHTADALKEIDAAIDAMDIGKIDAGLEKLRGLEPGGLSAENPKLFAARIQQLNKERAAMKKPFRGASAAVAAAVVLAMGITAYASGVFNVFSFQKGDEFVSVRTTENMTEQEARELVSVNVHTPENKAGHEAEDTSRPGNAAQAEAVQAETEEFVFASLEQAEAELDMKIPLPAALPEMRLDSATGSIAYFGESHQTRTAWLNYADGAGRMFGVTETRDIIKPGSDVTSYTSSEIDGGSLGEYTSRHGVKFTTLTGSDDTGEKVAHIATVTVGEYEYTLVFAGFEESERHEIIDSADLSGLR